jgi:hypothetical protein
MTSIRLRAGAALAAVALATGACGGDEPTVTATTAPPTTASPTAAPSPTGPVTFTQGEASVDVTGDRTESFTATVDDESTFDPDDNGYDLLFVDDDGNALRVGLDWETGADDSPFIAVGLPGTSLFDENYFPDQFNSKCQVEVTSATPFAIEGSFSCEDLERGDAKEMIDATGTFSATA